MKSIILKSYIEIFKKEISSFNSDAVYIKDNELVYSLKKNYSRDISSYTQNVLGELGRALVIINLLEKYKIPPSSILLEEKSIVGSPSKRIDIKIEIAETYSGRRCIALVECKTSIHKISDSEFTNYFKRQLYNIAHSYAKDFTQLYPLILITYEISFNEKKKIEIFYRWFFYPEIEKTVETGQISLDEIISRTSSFAYDTLPVISGNKIYFYKKPLTKNDLLDIKNPNELKNLLKEKLHQGLRNYGIVEEKAFETIINLLLAKTFDELELLKKENKEPDFQVKPEDYLNKESFYNRIKSLLENALIQLLRENPRDAAKKELLEHKDKEKILLEVVPYLQRIKLRSLRFLGEDSMGDVFLDFMHSIFRQSRGLFFTHPNICKFVCKALNIQKIGDELKKGSYKYILDTSCGSGTFLIEALRLIFKDYPIEKIKEDALKILFGIDNESRATALCKVNMVIHGDGSANIYTRNSLLRLENLPLPFIKESSILRGQECVFESIKENCGVDFIISNPPFSLEIRKEASHHFVMNKFVPFRREVTTASECFFIERWFQLLNPNGKIGVVLPASILDSVDYLKARLLLICYFSISAIVGLPDFAFAPHAQQKTYLVFGKRRSLDEANRLFRFLVNGSTENLFKSIENEKIVFYEAKEIGYVRVKQRKTIITKLVAENDLNDELAKIISEALEGKYPTKNGVVTLTIREIFKLNKNLNLTNFSRYPPSKRVIILKNNNWKIAAPEKIEQIDLKKSIFLCETGDILEGGSGILLPHLIKNGNVYGLEQTIITYSIFKDITFPQMSSLKEVSISKKRRILEKIKKSKFGKLKEGDIIIAPVRLYLKKIAVVYGSAVNFIFSKDFIVLRKDRVDLKESFSLFLSLIHDANIKQLEKLSSIGKSGYPKIKNKEAILQIGLYEAEVSHQKIEELIKLYENIYKNIVDKNL
ncbi:MAG: N-6 DNA methylase [Candidatus Pacearchaeota archaeon]